MAINIINSANSFVRFGDTVSTHCIWGNIDFCLPVYNSTDVYFQFIASADTAVESEYLCLSGAAEVSVSIVNTCGGSDLIAFAQKPTRYRLSPTQVLYNWSHGFPGFPTGVSCNECFKIQISLEVNGISQLHCSNCFERVCDDCFTSVLEYGNEEDAFGFKYCTGGGVEEDPVTCEPTIVTFTNLSTLSIPYTAQLQAKYGNLPNVQIWIYDSNGVLTNMNIQATFDAYPPTVVNFDFGGGPSSGIIIFR